MFRLLFSLGARAWLFWFACMFCWDAMGKIYARIEWRKEVKQRGLVEREEKYNKVRERQSDKIARGKQVRERERDSNKGK